jgi:putative oxidoreductase
MKYLPAIAGVLLGLIFAFASLAYFFNLVEAPPPPKDSAVEHFFIAIASTGYLTFIKVIELMGAVLVAIPFTRRLGMLLLGPIVVNILAFHLLVARDGIANPMLIAVTVLSLYLLWAERRAFAAYLRGGPSPA